MKQRAKTAPTEWRCDIRACDSGLLVEDYLTDTFFEITDVSTCQTQGYALNDHAALLFAAAPKLLRLLQRFLGDRPEVQGGICQHCGRDYISDFLEGDCLSEDCVAFQARSVVAIVEGRGDQ